MTRDEIIAQILSTGTPKVTKDHHGNVLQEGVALNPVSEVWHRAATRAA